MITCQKLDIYLKYGGDPDIWGRVDKFGLDDITWDEWNLIDQLLQGLHLISKGLVSEEYKQRIEKTFLEATADEQTRSMLRKMQNKFTDFKPE